MIGACGKSHWWSLKVTPKSSGHADDVGTSAILQTSKWHNGAHGEHNGALAGLVNIQKAMEAMAQIEIDGLPIKNGDFLQPS